LAANSKARAVADPVSTIYRALSCIRMAKLGVKSSPVNKYAYLASRKADDRAAADINRDLTDLLKANICWIRR
jgi:hypothetical protein